jgi:hypothetical protein
MEYKIVKTNEPEKLSEKVTQQIAQGWELYGNPSVALTVGNAIYVQALIKADEGVGVLAQGIAEGQE